MDSKEVDAITCAVVSSATEHQHQRPSKSRTEADYEVWNLIEERKSVHTADERQEVSRRIQELLKQRRLHAREKRVRARLKDGKG